MQNLIHKERLLVLADTVLLFDYSVNTSRAEMHFVMRWGIINLIYFL